MHHVDRVFIDDIVLLDGHSFARCHFKRCSLVFAGGALPDFGESVISEDCEWRFAGPAGRTIEFINRLKHADLGGEMIDALFPFVATVVRSKNGGSS